VRIAILDDYQRVARSLLDATGIDDEAEVVAFSDHVADEDELVARLADFDVVVAMRERTAFPAALLGRLAHLRLLVTTGMANAAIDLEAAARGGILVCGTSSVVHPTAELTWGLILSLTRRIAREDSALRAGRWQTTLGTGLQGRTLGIVGLGRLGTRVAVVARAFGMRVLAWSENLTAARAAEAHAEAVTKHALFAEADVVTVHLRLSERTRGLIGEQELGWMKPTAYLVNTSRGPIVEEPALVEALARREIAGAGLDVFDSEPLPASSPLLRAPNTVLTPHLGYVTSESYEVYFEEAVADIRAFRDGAPVRALNRPC
jgi:phosphoglycerate dehydrogenase-like enzyme